MRKRVERKKSKSNLLVEVVVRKSFVKLNFKETDKKEITKKPASYYASLICFGDILNSAGKVAEAVIPAEEKEKFKKEFYSELIKVKEVLNKTISEDRYGS
jgi:hypothetical protein